MKKLTHLLRSRPAPNRMTLATFLLCMLPSFIGLGITCYTKATTVTMLATMLSLSAYIITKLVVEIRYEAHEAATKATLEIQN